MKERPCKFCGKIFVPIERDEAYTCSRSCRLLIRYYPNLEAYTKKGNILGSQTITENQKIITCPITNKTIIINNLQGTVLKRHLTSINMDHVEFFTTYYPEYIIKCKLCGKVIQLKYNLHISGLEDPFCNKAHYTEHMKQFPFLYRNEVSIQKQSATMKRKIADGDWTPCVTNSWANSRITLKVNGTDYEFRSTWEAFFWILNQSFQYEKIRIPYFDTVKQKTRTYITDFYDPTTQTVYEVKPKSNQVNQNVIDKHDAAIVYCKDNNMIYKVITEDYFYQNLTLIENYVSLNPDDKLENSLISFKRKLPNEFSQS